MAVYSEQSYAQESGASGKGLPNIKHGEFSCPVYMEDRCEHRCPAPAMKHIPQGWQCHRYPEHSGPHITTDYPDDGPLIAYWYTDSSEL